MFFLPFGYDMLFKAIMDYSGSYAIADCVFYTLSATFLIIHFTVSKVNPVIEINKKTLEAKIKLMELKSKI